MTRSKGKNAKAIASKHLDLYQKWKKAVKPETGGGSSIDQVSPLIASGPELSTSGNKDDSSEIAAVEDIDSTDQGEEERLTKLVNENLLSQDQKDSSKDRHAFQHQQQQGNERRPSEIPTLTQDQSPSVLERLHAHCLAHVIPELTAQLSLNGEGQSRAAAFLSDRSSLFRFWRRSRYDFDKAVEMITATLQWRLKTKLDLVNLATLHPLYVEGRWDPEADGKALQQSAGEEGDGEGSHVKGSGTPLFWLSNRFVDHYGRPCGVISLRSLERVSPGSEPSREGDDGESGDEAAQDPDEDYDPDAVEAREEDKKAESGGLSEVKEYIVAAMEIVRKYLEDAYRKSLKEKGGIDAVLARIATAEKAEEDPEAQLEEAYENCPPLQMTIAFDLASSGMANLELELLPFLLDLLKNHFPGMVGAVYVLHFGWLHSGMWAVAKRVLPQQALARIFFPNEQELRDEHFEPSKLPQPFGGDWDVELNSEHNETMRKYGKVRRFKNFAATRAGGGTGWRSAGASRLNSIAPSPSESPMVGGRLNLGMSNGNRSKSSLSRTQSFESIYDVFYSTEVTPWASRQGTPRHSQPSTPGHENAGRNATWRMTPSAARKLKSLQMSRGGSGDGSTAVNIGGRRRADSDAKASAASAFASSTIQSADRTPQGYSSPVDERPATGRRSRTQSISSVGGGNGGSGSMSPITRSRVGGARRDFKLFIPTAAQETAARDRLLGADSEDEFSSAENGRRGSDVTVRAAPEQGFFARWRRRSSLLLSSPPSTSEGETSDPAKVAKDQYSRSLRRGLQEQQKRQHIQNVFPSPFDSPKEAQGSFEGALGMSTGPPVAVHAEEVEEVSPLETAVDRDSAANNHPQNEHHRSLSVSRSKRYSKPGQVSPYNADNPYFGYPAYIAPYLPGGGRKSNQAQANSRYHLGVQTPRHLHARRRKRDLVRTLSYLFFLRILAAHRSVRWKVKLLWTQIIAFVSSPSLDVLWNRNGSDIGSALPMSPRQRQQEQQRLNRSKQIDKRPLYMRKSAMLFFVALLAVLHQGFRSNLAAWIQRILSPSAAPAASQAADQVKSAAANGTSELRKQSKRMKTVTGFHVRRRLGFTSA